MKEAANSDGEHIVYVLGAGFSAPLGLPLVSNFLECARDQYAADPGQFRHFRKVFDRINQLALVRRAYFAPLHNIEEVLSLLEMQDSLAGTRRKGLLEKFICDVIEFHTPRPMLHQHLSANNWHRFAFGMGSNIEPYVHFVCSLFQLTVEGRQGGEADEVPANLIVGKATGTQCSYSVVTLNYDCVLERCAQLVSDSLRQQIAFSRDQSTDLEPNTVPLAKLHGDVAVGSIVPPTWSKGSQHLMRSEWRRAFECLRRATQVRVIGYSLADSDTYVRYLLKTAALDSERVKRFDVLCMDDSAGAVEKRFNQFVELPQFRFRGLSVMEFLQKLERPAAERLPNGSVKTAFRNAEAAHKSIFGG